MTSSPLTHGRVLKLAVPVMLAQAATAATGVVDTAVMGLTGDATDLAAIAVASVVFSFLYWGFGFLRMATTGLVAQAMGRNAHERARGVLQRALIVGAGLGLALVLLAPLLRLFVFAPFGVDVDVADGAQAYFGARIWGAPALLMGYGIMGWLLGTGRTGHLLLFQIFSNAVNAVLDIWFVAGLDWGPAGVGAGTAIAEWAALALGLFFIRRERALVGDLWQRAAIFELLSANRDILIRTLALLFSFSWFIRSGAQFGTARLAGNEVLLQFVSVAAFVLDGFAFIAEKEVGQAYGAGNAKQLRRAMRVTTHLALAAGACIALLYFLAGPSLVRSFVSDVEARDIALAFLPFCAVVPLLGVPAWQLDGFFLGATQGRALRNASIASALAYIALDLVLSELYGNSGVWMAFLAMYVTRALALSFFLPSLLRPPDHAAERSISPIAK